MKATLEFSLPEEIEEFETAIKADKYRAALWEVSQRVFRPARKHGYSSLCIQDLLDKADTVSIPAPEGGEASAGTELISQLEKLFYEILQEEGVEL